MESLLTISEVCQLLKVSKRTVQRWSKNGRLRPIRLSSRIIRFKKSDIERFLKSHDEIDRIVNEIISRLDKTIK